MFTIARTLQFTPIITLQPENQTVEEGQTATFRVEANCDGPLGFQWWNGTSGQWNSGDKNGRLEIINTNNSSTISIKTVNVNEDDGDQFLCEVKNLDGYPADGYWVNSNTVKLNIKFLTIIPTSRNVEYLSGKTTFAITSNIDWVVHEDEDWLLVYPDSGTGNETITATFEENTTSNQRIGIIIVTGHGLMTTVKVNQEGTTGIDDLHFIISVPDMYALYANYPNPFNPSTRIEFDIPEESTVNLIIYDILGKKIMSLLENGILNTGKYTYTLKPDNLTTGIYFYAFIAKSINSEKSFTAFNKMLLLK